MYAFEMQGLSSTFCHLCLPPTGLGGSTLTRCGGTQEEDGGTVLWWESISLVNADTSQTPITVSDSKADLFIRMSYKEIYMYPGSEDATWSPPVM